MTGESAAINSGLPGRVSEWASRFGLGRKLAVGLAIASLVSALVTYGALSGSSPFTADAHTILILLNVDLVVFLLLCAVVARRLVGIWIERRRGAMGARLHTRLVVLFSLVALTPAIIVSVFSAVFFSFGMQAWFSERVKTALTESHLVAQAYLKEHQQVIRGDVLSMARDLNRAAPSVWINRKQFSRIVAAHGLLRNLTEAYVFDANGQVLAHWNLGYVLDRDPIPLWALDRARGGEVVLLTGENDDRLRAVVRLEGQYEAFLYVGRYVEPKVLNHIERTRRAVTQYENLEGRRSSIEISFAMMFLLVALMLLMAAIWLGLNFATRLTKPITALATAAERVRAGDLAARVEEGATNDELGLLNRAFNRMTDQLEDQRSDLIEANRQLEARRHFIENVLSGVSAGVIGLDSEGRINLSNRTASALLSVELEQRMGDRLRSFVPEMRSLLRSARQRPKRMVESQIDIRRDGDARTLLVRIVCDRVDDKIDGFVVTFDDVTELLSAQRKAAWSDIARRIAHEIKNPLTPIQLSAERLRSKYLDQISHDPDTFSMCTDTIVRQVSDIGRMVDEFSSFARMPAPAMKTNDLVTICQPAMSLQQTAHPEIEFAAEFGDSPVEIVCDGRQIGQALTNLLQNAADSIEGREALPDEALPGGRISLRIVCERSRIAVEVTDNGRGLPREQRHRLTEPYVTTRERGTGLGLAIVKKIMEDHGGQLLLEDGDTCGATARLVLSRSDIAVRSLDDNAAPARKREASVHDA